MVILWMIIIIIVVLVVFVVVRNKKGHKYVSGPSVTSTPSSKHESSGPPLGLGGRAPLSDRWGAGKGGKSSGREASEESPREYDDDDPHLKGNRPAFRLGDHVRTGKDEE